MATKNINTKLNSLYSSNLNNLDAMYKEMKKQGLEDYTTPLLLACHDGYEKAKKKILFVGQETCGWIEHGTNKVCSEAEIKTLQDGYLEFLLEISRTYSTPFWNFINWINNRISPDSVGFMWSNIWKIGKSSGAGRADKHINDFELQYFDIDKDEVEILQPDVIVFLSGPEYDEDIKKHFGKFEIVQNYGKCFDQLSIDGIEAKAFRLYHPAYLQRSGLTQAYREKLFSLM